MATKQLTVVGGHPDQPATTARKDSWWIGPATTVAILGAFSVYATWAAMQGVHYYAAPYLSPFYSPPLFVDLAAEGTAPLWHSWFGTWPDWWPKFLPSSPAILILAFPLSFRFTCYYYRKAYYRAFAGSPPACAVVPMAKGKKPYKGERGLLVFQNLHRYALYFALLFVVILSYDAAVAFVRYGELGIGVGSVVLTINAGLIACYTFGCHSFRHLIAGHDDCMSCGKESLKAGAWRKASWLNARHMRFAWLSLFWVAFSDIYVRLVSMGVIQDFNTWDA